MHTHAWRGRDLATTRIVVRKGAPKGALQRRHPPRGSTMTRVDVENG